MQRVGFEPWIHGLAGRCLKKRGRGGFTFKSAIFIKIIQHLLHSKVAKAESYLIGGYHNE